MPRTWTRATFRQAQYLEALAGMLSEAEKDELGITPEDDARYSIANDELSGSEASRMIGKIREYLDQADKHKHPSTRR